MHIERERENMKLRRLTAATGQQNTGHPPKSFKSVSLPPPSQPTLPTRPPTLPSQPVNQPKRELKLTVRIKKRFHYLAYHVRFYLVVTLFVLKFSHYCFLAA